MHYINKIKNWLPVVQFSISCYNLCFIAKVGDMQLCVA